MTSPAPAAEPLLSEGRSPAPVGRTPIPRRLGASLPTWDLIATKHLELRKRRGLMITVAVMIIAPTVLILGLRLGFHLFDPAHYGPAGDPSRVRRAGQLDGGVRVHRRRRGWRGGRDHRPERRRVPLPGDHRPVASGPVPGPHPGWPGHPGPGAGRGVHHAVPGDGLRGRPAADHGQHGQRHLDTGELRSGPAADLGQAASAAGGTGVPAQSRSRLRLGWLDESRPGVPTSFPGIATAFSDYTSAENSQFDPAANEMFKIGLWLGLEIGIGFLVGLGLGALTGQRTLSTILLIALEIIVTPLLARTPIPYFLDGQRVDVGVAMDQLRPAALAPGGGPGGGGPGGGVLFGGRGALGIPPMPTWAMISVIVGWIVVWSVIGAWRMMTRDA